MLEKIRKSLDESSRPVFFFDDDPDGLSSFLLLYRYKGEGKGIVVKSTPELSEAFSQKVDDHDLVVILDKPMVAREFFEKVKTPIIWIDHHEPQKMGNGLYFNPRTKDSKDGRPTTYWCHKISGKDNWIAAVGCLGDWFVPDFEVDPELLAGFNNPGDLMFKAPLGKLVRIFSFVLKGTGSEAMKYVKVLTRINDPFEILESKTVQGKYLYKRYEYINKLYQDVLKDVTFADGAIIYTYKDNHMSFSADLANELLYNNPDKVIVVGREKSGEVKCSIRSSHFLLPPIVKKALEGVEGYGGGHEHACGACIKVKDFEKFKAQLIENSANH